MSQMRPELVFMAGPQTDRRVVLRDNVILVGRDPSAKVRLKELHTSRRQLEFRITREGWMVENLSSNQIIINGKKYKTGKRIYLDTGDIIAVGSETLILFVSAGDDPDQAAQAYRQEHPVPRPEQPVEEPVPPSPQVGPAGELPAHPPAEALKTIPPPTTQEISPPQKKDTSKARKYVIFGGVYAAAILALIVFVASMKKDDGNGPAGTGAIDLSDEQIEEILTAPLEQKTPNPVQADQALKRARTMYVNRDFKPGNLFRCVKNYREHLAYSRSSTFDSVEDSSKFLEARKKLVDRVIRQYRRAWKYEQKRDWRQAEFEFKQLQAIIPDQDNRITKNVLDHISYIKRHKLSRRR